MKRTQQSKQDEHQNRNKDQKNNEQMEKKPADQKSKRHQDQSQQKDMHPDHGQEECHGQDCVQEASEESFPASDPPSFTPTKGT